MQRLTLTSFCTKDDRKKTFTQAHSKDVEAFVGKWGKWGALKGIIVLFLFFLPTYLAILLIGVGSTKPNERDSEEEEVSEELKDDA